MAKINYTAIDFKERIAILEAIVERDNERNVIKDYRDIAEVWANVQTKQRYVQTQAGEKPYFLNVFTIRYNASLLPKIDAVRYHGRICELTLPPYAIDNKYITFEVQEDYGKEQRICEFADLP